MIKNYNNKHQRMITNTNITTRPPTHHHNQHTTNKTIIRDKVSQNAQDLSHFSYHAPDGKELLCDLQKVKTGKS